MASPRRVHGPHSRLIALLMVFLSLMLAPDSKGQLSLDVIGQKYLIDFDSTVAGVNAGQFLGTGFNPDPDSGQINSNGIIVTGLSDGDLDFGNTGETGDFARGTHNGGTATGGIYAFLVETDSRALGVQPTGDDWTPGTFVLRMLNNTGEMIVDLQVAYDIYVRNDQNRANSFNFSHSIDHVNYTDEPALDYTSPEAADSLFVWHQINRSIILRDVDIPVGEYYYLRWRGDDVSGGGARDEFALDNIRITAHNMTLPITLLSFDARASGSDVRLDWTFADAVGFDRFVIEHSEDAHRWQEIGNVAYTPTLGGNRYASFVHRNPPSGSNYYRLRMVDIDGSSDLSPVRYVMVRKQSNITLRHSVATSTLTIDHDPGLSDGKVFIYDAMGRLLSAHPMDAGAHSTVVHVNALTPGLYYASAVYNGMSETLRFLKD